jgi:type IV fimbrial biogenesis protein FimT
MGRRRRHEVDERGFTLIELIVTLVVLAVTVGVVAPVVGRSTEMLRGRSEVARFSAMLRYARDQAISTQQDHSVVLDPSGHRATIVAGVDEIRQTRTLPPDLAIAATPPEALTVRFDPSGVSTGGDFHLSTASVRFRVTVDPLTGRVRVERQSQP